MTKRIVFGAIMIAALVGLIWLDYVLEQGARLRLAAAVAEQVGQSAGRLVVGYPLAALVAVLTVAALAEVSRLAESVGVKILPVSGLAGSLLLGTAPFWWQFAHVAGVAGRDLLPVLGFIVLVVFAEQMIRWRVEDALRRVACTLLAVVYLGVGGAIMLQMRIAWGLPALVLFLAAVKFTDIGAYFTGTAIGRHKMIPWLSPGKSWEGLAGGLAAAAGISMLVVLASGRLSPPLVMPLWQAAVFGVVVGAAGQFADLCESLLKRSAGAKDSGAIIPGFGGLLDILDSPLLAAPVALALLEAMRG